MCGIAGVVTCDQLAPDDPARVAHMSRLLAHRGPDDAGRYLDRHAAIAHRRMTVIDPAGGHQPMANEDGTLWLSFNGEVYNHNELRADLTARGHRFASRCDAEVVLHAYEDDPAAFIERLCGMFAFALWDARRRCLLLARDRLGVKPLYYHTDGRRIVFASELKAVLAGMTHAPRPDATAVVDYLAFGFVPSPRSIFSGVHKLEPATLLRFEAGRTTQRTFWRLRHAGYRDEPPAALAEALWAELSRATAARLEADVPLGVLLSGGLDSIAVAAAAANAAPGPALSAWTVTFNGQSPDERATAAAAAQQLGLVHFEAALAAPPTRILPLLAWHCDEPLADPSVLPFFGLCAAARRGLAVALSGDGGDEALAGYRRYRFDRAEEQARRWFPASLRRPLFGMAARLYPRTPWLPRPLRAQRTLANLADDGPTAHARSIAHMDGAAALALLHPDLRAAAADYDPFDHVRDRFLRCDAPDHLARCQSVDIRFSLADGILAKVDRVSMAHALEIRSPMLDHRFVDFAASIPPPLRLSGGRGKRLLRDALRARLGSRLADQPKRGFEVPLDAWFRAGLRGHLPLPPHSPFTAARQDCGGAPLLEPRAVAHIESAHRDGRARHGATLWAICMLQAWAGHFLDPTADRASPRLAPPAPASDATPDHIPAHATPTLASRRRQLVGVAS